MAQKIKVPYAIANFERIREDGYYFIDKTKYVELLEQYTAPVFLRPRRFGKTLLCSILECYYDVNRKDKFEFLFGNTYIGKNPTREKNSCMVMRFNFSEVSVLNELGKIENSFNNICKAVLDGFFIKYKKYLKKINFENKKTADIVANILKQVKGNNLPPLYIIIDEYDNFTNQLIQSHSDGMYQELTTGNSFLRTFFKVIKAGTEDNSVRRCYITGVLPITIDDLTSGFNIAEILTLNKRFHSMLGFNQQDINSYVDGIFESYNFDKKNANTVKILLKKYYNGYRFMPEAETLYNSTISTFFMRAFIENDGEIPRKYIDDNIRTDVNWIRRLAGGSEKAREMTEKLMFQGDLDCSFDMVEAKFNMRQFFEEEFFPVSLFYLGMLTVKDRDSLTFPNQTLETIFADYFNDLSKISMLADKYAPAFRQFNKDLDLEKLFANYWKEYVSQIVAQACDKVNENFYRTTFFKLCQDYLAWDFVLNIESNYPSGRSDLEFLGKYHTKYKNLKWIVEFKHFSKEAAKKEGIYDLKAPRKQEVDQVSAHAKDILADFPEYDMTLFVIYTISCEEYSFFKV